MISCLVLTLLLALPPDQYDTVVLSNGGVLRGAVLKDLPGESLVIELTSGDVWTIPRSEVARIDYATRAPPSEEPVQEPGEPVPDVPEAAAPPQSAAASLEHVPALQAGVSMGLALPLGHLDGSGLALGSAVSPQLTFTFEGTIRPMVELELGLYLLLGGGTSYEPLNGYCLAAGAWCDASDLALGFFPRWSFNPRGAVNPWVMVSGGLEWMSVWNEYRDAFDYFGWQVGGAAGVDLRLGGSVSVSFQLGTRWGQFTSLTVSGLLPYIGLEPAMHGWIDLGVRANYGL